jgi:hypothetical protein
MQQPHSAGVIRACAFCGFLAVNVACVICIYDDVVVWKQATDCWHVFTVLQVFSAVAVAC